MALWFTLHVNRDDIGMIEIRRTQPFDASDPAILDQVFTYEVRLDGELCGTVEHPYRAGPWSLVTKAAMLVDVTDRNRPWGREIPANTESERD